MSSAKSTNFEIALSYARKGWRVFPLHWALANGKCSCRWDTCKSVGKHPLTKSGCKDATISEEQLSLWFNKWPEANIGIATGHESGLAVLDVDPRHDGDNSLRSLERQFAPLPKTVCALTGGGGQHFFFIYPETTVKNAADILPGLDFRGDGGYVVAPPSMHQSGRSYQWDSDGDPDEVELSPIPPWLLNLLSKPKRTPYEPPPI